jgi:hypothetical protein
MPLLENPFPVNRSCLAIVVGVGVVVLMSLLVTAPLVQLEKIIKIKNGIKIDLIRLALFVF